MTIYTKKVRWKRGPKGKPDLYQRPAYESSRHAHPLTIKGSMQSITRSDNRCISITVQRPRHPSRVRCTCLNCGDFTRTGELAVKYTAGHVPRDRRPLGPNSILDNVRELYVVTSPMKQHLVLFCCQKFMRENGRSWCSAASWFLLDFRF